MTPKPREPQKTTTIEISIATKDKIHSIRTQIEKIVNPHGHKKKLSYDDILNIVFSLRSIDEQLSELILKQ